MIGEIREKYALSAPKVLAAMLKVPREQFVPKDSRNSAYEDEPIPIGWSQTISQPYTVAFMTNLLNLKGTEKVLEIGTGSGYQAAILSLLTPKVYSIEIIPELAKSAGDTLKRLGYKNVNVRQGSGEWGWKEEAPFDAIIVTAGIEDVPQELLDQLKDGGVLVAPLGVGPDKIMTKLVKKVDGTKKRQYGVFHFVPFVEEKN
jgi:protein-L-isoaspartate(D-aspartate) O-methyltransferase